MRIPLRTAAVTGAGSGLGRAVTLGLAAHGVRVFALDVDADAVAGVVRAVEEAGGQADGLVSDVGSEAAVGEAFAAIARAGEGLDGLVTCAGITSTTPILDLTVAQWDRVMAINLRGTFLCVQEALRLMHAKNFGRIVTVASDVGKRGGGRLARAAYGASKGGVIAFTRSVARELAGPASGIRINCVCPGPMLTTMHRALADADRARVAGSVPLGRFGTAEEVANAVLFLLSDEASFVYGETFAVDGGVVMD